MKGDEVLECNDLSCDYFRCIFAKEKEFYSANEAYVFTNEEDATKSFNSVNPTMKQQSVPYISSLFALSWLATL